MHYVTYDICMAINANKLSLLIQFKGTKGAQVDHAVLAI